VDKLSENSLKNSKEVKSLERKKWILTQIFKFYLKPSKNHFMLNEMNQSYFNLNFNFQSKNIKSISELEKKILFQESVKMVVAAVS
jgi:hypothetical protein